MSKKQLISELRDLGVKTGSTVFVHSSLSKLGFVEGGAETVVAALLESVGPSGTIAMPAYPISDYSIDALKKEPIFDPTKDPSRMGKITEIFRLQKGVLRSSHYTHSCCALGPAADFLTRDHESSITPVGPGSPYARLIEEEGFVLALGSTFGHITFYHVIEDQMANFPYQVYYPDILRGPIRSKNGDTRYSQYRLHDPKIYLGKRIDLNSKKETEMLMHFRQAGILHEGPVGAGEAKLFPAVEAANLLRRLAERGVTIYQT
ncbi:AAC(3) family N-acetyltransferase [bacterium]|nr:AAC(3) family N-acetyltransferase [bacterium]